MLRSIDFYVQSLEECSSGSYGVFKQRVARQGSGKSGGFRTIIVFRIGGHGFLIHGFAKTEKANVTPKELEAKKSKGGILDTIHKSVAGLRRAGVVDMATMREFDALCLTPVLPMAPEESERGEKRPDGRRGRGEVRA